jgi:hypothetical protein
MDSCGTFKQLSVIDHIKDKLKFNGSGSNLSSSDLSSCDANVS